LFFILNFLAPLATGFVIGFIIGKIPDSLAISFIGTVFSYCIVFVISEWFLGFTNSPLDIAVAVLIMGVLGITGGVIGSLTSSRIRS
jgi:hypothetical protein